MEIKDFIGHHYKHLLITGGEGFVRISYAVDEDVVIEGLRRLKEWLLEK